MGANQCCGGIEAPSKNINISISSRKNDRWWEEKEKQGLRREEKRDGEARSLVSLRERLVTTLLHKIASISRSDFT